MRCRRLPADESGIDMSGARGSLRIRNLSLGSLLYTSRKRPGAQAWNCSAMKENVSDVPLVLVVEDEYALQGLVEEALREGGFETRHPPPGRKR
jgi:hypothetical protein